MPDRWQTLRARLAEPFRITVIREETFEEVDTYSVNWANVLALAAAGVVAVALATFGVVAVTPLRTLLPGFGAIDERSELVQLNRELRELERTVGAQTAYTDNIQRVLVGDVSRYDEAAARAEGTAEFADSALTVERIPEDEALRQDVAGARTRYAERAGGGGGAGVPLGHLHFVAPLKGQVSSAFDAGDAHYGVDVVAPAGTAVKSALGGYVVQAGWTLEYGNVVAVQHAGDLLTFYKHNDRLLKRRGERVSAGEAIAVIGNTGTRTDGPHLHFELWYRGRPVNPVAFVSF